MKDLVTPVDQMSDEQLLEKVRQMRHNREVLRPAKAARADRVVKKEKQAKSKKTDALIKNLSAADRAALIAMLSAPGESA